MQINQARSFMSVVTTIAIAVATLAMDGSRGAGAATPLSAYDADSAWLCRPGRADVCAQPLQATRYGSDGTWQPLPAEPAAAQPPIDCFYVYPTVSQAPQGNSPWAAGAGELRAVELQAAPFNSLCRVFAPVYRQVTLAGLSAGMGGGALAVDRDLPLADVRAAWQHYLQHDNQGRGVLLLGHSQGSRVLQQLIAQEIEGTPVQHQLVAAYLIGMDQFVPTGQRVGDSFQSLPVCASAQQTGCLVAYSTFRSDQPPGPQAHFGRSERASREVVCVDVPALVQASHAQEQPASPAADRAAVPRVGAGWGTGAMLRTDGNLLGQPWEAGPWQQAVASVRTPWVALPDYVHARCVREGAQHYMAVSLNPAGDARAPRPQACRRLGAWLGAAHG